MGGGTFARAGAGLEERDIEPEVFSEFEVQLIFGVEAVALELEGALVIIIAFLQPVGQRMEISLVYTMIIGTLLRGGGSTYRSQAQLLVG